MTQKHNTHDEQSSSRLSYSEKFKAMDKEALATLILALVITAFFWGAILLLKDSALMLFSMPAWFIVSCIGGYLLSVIGVIFLAKKIMVDFPLDDNAEEAQISETSDHLGEVLNERN